MATHGMEFHAWRASCIRLAKEMIHFISNKPEDFPGWEATPPREYCQGCGGVKEYVLTPNVGRKERP